MVSAHLYRRGGDSSIDVEVGATGRQARRQRARRHDGATTRGCSTMSGLNAFGGNSQELVLLMSCARRARDPLTDNEVQHVRHRPNPHPVDQRFTRAHP